MDKFRPTGRKMERAAHRFLEAIRKQCTSTYLSTYSSIENERQNRPKHHGHRTWKMEIRSKNKFSESSKLPSEYPCFLTKGSSGLRWFGNH